MSCDFGRRSQTRGTWRLEAVLAAGLRNSMSSLSSSAPCAHTLPPAKGLGVSTQYFQSKFLEWKVLSGYR